MARHDFRPHIRPIPATTSPTRPGRTWPSRVESGTRDPFPPQAACSAAAQATMIPFRSCSCCRRVTGRCWAVRSRATRAAFSAAGRRSKVVAPLQTPAAW